QRATQDALGVATCRHATTVTFFADASLEVENLLGRRFRAVLRDASAAAHLIVNDRALRIRRDPQNLVLRVLPPHTRREDGVRLLRGTIDLFVRQALGLTWKESFEAEWARFARAGQVSVDAVRRQILEHLPAHLQTLNCREHPALSDALRDVQR